MFHVHCIAISVFEHQRRKAFLHRIRGLLILRPQCLLWNVLKSEARPSDCFKPFHHFKWAERFRSSKLDCLPHRHRVAKGHCAHLGNISKGHPTYRVCARSIDPRCSLRVIKTQGRTEPHFHEPTRFDDRKIHVRDCLLYFALGVPKRRGQARCLAKRYENKTFYICRFGRVHKIHLPGRVHGLNRISRLTRKG